MLRWPRTFASRLALIGGGALVVRLAFAIYQRRHIPFPFSDATKYAALANNIGGGHWFIDSYAYNKPNADHSPLYPLYLSILSFFRSGKTPEFDFVVWSVFLGVGSVIVIGLIGKEIISPRVGLIAAGLAAISPSMWVNDGLLLSEGMAILMTSCIILFAYKLWRRPSMWNVIWLGVFCGLGTLSRSELALSVPFVLFPLALLAAKLTWRKRIALIAVGCICAGLVISPWVIYNRSRFEQPVFLTTNFGRTMAAAKCRDAYNIPSLIGAQSYGCLAVIEARHGITPHTDESVADKIYRAEAWHYVRAHPGGTVKQIGAAWARILGIYRPFNSLSSGYVQQTQGRPAAFLVLISFYFLFPAAVIGGVFLHRRKIPVYPLAAFWLIIMISVAMTFAQQRYRAIGEPTLMVLTAVLIEEIVRRRTAAPPEDPAPVGQLVDA